MILRIEDDFDLDRIADSGQCFRWEKAEQGTYRVLHGAECLYITDRGNACYELDSGEDAFREVWSVYFDLAEDYRRLRERLEGSGDTFLRRAAEAEKGIRILRQDPWEMLISFIISQNRNIPAIRRSIALLAELCGERRTDSRGRTYYAFPAPEALAAADGDSLRRCSLGYRCGYVHAAAEAVMSGAIDLEALRTADEERTMAALTALEGVGPKVASCVSLFGLHHMDAFPKDVWIRRILEREYPEGYPFEAHSPYNGLYQQYMFAYYRKLHGREEG